ncbi:hypothetical protein [Croceicoccus naphthovorans]|uniref:Uncharacterized protein n=1 Tax=Croceicoccus naphthovorans TaxID=1348774 RepID=A0A0G3XKF3_9SPHN|nr:hypothetical protein [Croceicoccus naphthovorans]AKM11054.1 hypothetical protein AB433_15500 [Croceicoccus naphthovorans]MBB3989510.1 hypothetical protein [Croceicoccus naphthovorans]UBS33880.1 hypothetical protein LBX01_04455 [Altererythrobacter sp. N1]
MHTKTAVIAIVALMVGFGSGFMLRPVIAPAETATLGALGAHLPIPADEARGTQYFEANLKEARQVAEQCREGMVRGGECANAETAIIEAEGEENFDAFMGR